MLSRIVDCEASVVTNIIISNTVDWQTGGRTGLIRFELLTGKLIVVYDYLFCPLPSSTFFFFFFKRATAICVYDVVLFQFLLFVSR